MGFNEREVLQLDITRQYGKFVTVTMRCLGIFLRAVRRPDCNTRNYYYSPNAFLRPFPCFKTQGEGTFSTGRSPSDSLGAMSETQQEGSHFEFCGQFCRNHISVFRSDPFCWIIFKLVYCWRGNHEFSSGLKRALEFDDEKMSWLLSTWSNLDQNSPESTALSLTGSRGTQSCHALSRTGGERVRIYVLQFSKNCKYARGLEFSL